MNLSEFEIDIRLQKDGTVWIQAKTRESAIAKFDKLTLPELIEELGEIERDDVESISIDGDYIPA